MNDRITVALAVGFVSALFVFVSVPVTLLVNFIFYGAEITFFQVWVTLLLLVVVYNQIARSKA